MERFQTLVDTCAWRPDPYTSCAFCTLPISFHNWPQIWADTRWAPYWKTCLWDTFRKWGRILRFRPCCTTDTGSKVQDGPKSLRRYTCDFGSFSIPAFAAWSCEFSCSAPWLRGSGRDKGSGQSAVSSLVCFEDFIVGILFGNWWFFGEICLFYTSLRIN